MSAMSSSLHYLLTAWGAVTAVLAVLVIYGNTLSMREEDQLYLNKAEEIMIASEQRSLIAKMTRLSHVIVGLAVLSGALFLVSAGIWVWVGFNGL